MEIASPDHTPVIDQWQQRRQKAFKTVPEEGKRIKYLGKEFLVYPDTFWPYKDSQPLVRHFRVRPGEHVLDVGTGSGVIAIFACYQGAGRVVAVDVNPSAIRSATHNARHHGFDHLMEVKQSNLFEQLGDEQFDVITANLPFRNKPAPDVVARSQWDTDFRTNTRFFEEVARHLKPGGRIYFSQSNFGAIPEVKRLAKAAGFSIRKLADDSNSKDENKTFYAFVLRKVDRAPEA
ncbi:methyltransferase [Pseudoduganella namucuonensis]|uniref:Release factor glutamine methyltransferase n=1 Tax=Pseudoduganella namucuonensis TaxID=1035707 RepID=A0A1I7KPB3_9BURK|nr:methyltransferase [Pseudoduganella namucuonensis]SFU99250.1 release factor glutamine methyltransferase [Pseudoduganella namucuonensis]